MERRVEEGGRTGPEACAEERGDADGGARAPQNLKSRSAKISPTPDVWDQKRQVIDCLTITSNGGVIRLLQILCGAC